MTTVAIVFCGIAIGFILGAAVLHVAGYYTRPNGGTTPPYPIPRPPSSWRGNR